MRAVIFVNGAFNEPQRVRDLLRPDDLIIAVDGGTRYAWEVGAEPQLIVGDLDSLTAGEQKRLRSAGVEISSFPARKDQTDLELALHRAVAEGASAVVIVAALGGRLDQMMANLLLLTLPGLHDVDVRVVEGSQEAFLIRAEACIEGQPGDTVSLIPLRGDATGITTEGLEWALEDEPLRFGETRGISNVLKAEQASVRVRRGLLFCVVTHVRE